MALDPAANFVRGNTDAAIDATQTSVSVVDASIFPDPATEGEYNVVIWDAANHPRPDQDPDVEILRVTAIDTGTNTLTVVRAQEGTTGASHPSGSAVHLSPTAKMFSDIESEYTAAGEDFDGEGTSEFSNLQSLSTEEVIDDVPSSFEAFVKGSGNTNGYVSRVSRQVTADNTAVGLGNPDPNGGRHTSHIVVTGAKDSSNIFIDVVLVAGATFPSAVMSESRGSPGPRFYGNDGNGLEISIDDGGVSYNVDATATGSVPF